MNREHVRVRTCTRRIVPGTDGITATNAPTMLAS